jgi:hypothetical protein
MSPEITVTNSLLGRDNRGCFIKSPSTGIVPGLNQIPGPLFRENQHLEPPFKLVENPVRSRNSGKESSLKEGPLH